ncbi:putative Acyl-CoA N-acyltransferase [Burkholderiales bacterium GJ-E10]|nr:putative Acyl-CoA N-acyltransferase [Burkholderiales bacterium GJ-E10]
MHTQTLGTPLPDWLPPPAPQRHPLHGRLCRLEPLDPVRHATALFDAYAQDSAGRGWTYLPYGPFAEAADYAAWMETIAHDADPLLFAIVDAASDRPVGVAGYLRITPAAGSIEIGHLHFSPQLQRTPMATEAPFLLMREAFTLGYRRLEWKCDSLNQPSRRAATRLGFRYEGTFRQATVVKRCNRDTAWFSIIDGEWPALRNAIERWLDPGNFDPDGRQRIALTALTDAVSTPTEP